MAVCDIDTMDFRHARRDIKATIGESLSITFSMFEADGTTPLDLSGYEFTAGLVDVGGAEVDPSPWIVSRDVANSRVTISIPGSVTDDEPFGPGRWTWWLAGQNYADLDPTYWVGGELSLYRVGSYFEQSSGEPIAVKLDGEMAVLVNFSQGPNGQWYWTGSQLEYDNLPSYDPDVLYVVTDGVTGASDATPDATGRLRYGGMEVGDTGVHELPLLNGWTLDYVRVQRVGDRVTMTVRGNTASDDAATSDVLVTLPAGYVPYEALIQYQQRGDVLMSVRGASGDVEIQRQMAANAYYQVSWMTREPWPATLPAVEIEPPLGG